MPALPHPDSPGIGPPAAQVPDYQPAELTELADGDRVMIKTETAAGVILYSGTVTNRAGERDFWLADAALSMPGGEDVEVPNSLMLFPSGANVTQVLAERRTA